jgi:hypothetical protein
LLCVVAIVVLSVHGQLPCQQLRPIKSRRKVRGSLIAYELSEPSLRRDDAWRHKRVATAAYYLAANRGFEPGHEAEDWSLAELQTDAIDAGRKL